MKAKIIAGIAVLIVCAYLFFYAIGPVLLAGPPLPLFSIRNKDAESHEVIVEVFDSDKLVLREIYTLNPGQQASYERSFGWYPKITWYFITWSEGVYTFRITLDGRIAKTHVVNVHPFKETVITIQNNSINVGEVVV